MGVVFKPEQIMSGSIPEEGAHYEAGQYLLDKMIREPDPIPEDGSRGINHIFCISSAMVYGSTAMGTADVRSDVDLLVRYDPGMSTTAIDRFRAVVKQTEDTFKTPVEGRLIPTGNLPAFVDPLFLRHVLKIQDDERWSCHWPFSWEHVPDLTTQDLTDIAYDYCEYKANSISRRLTEYRGEVNYRALQRAFELPNALGRKVLAAVQKSPEVTSIDEGQKLTTLASMRHAIIDTDTAYASNKYNALAHFDRLVELNEEYNDSLRMTLSGARTITTYKRSIEASYDPALTAAYGVVNFWLATFIAQRIQDWSLKQTDTVDSLSPEESSEIIPNQETVIFHPPDVDY